MTSPLRYNEIVQINQPAPDFELPDLEGNLQRLSDYRGQDRDRQLLVVRVPAFGADGSLDDGVSRAVGRGCGDAVHCGESERIHFQRGRGTNARRLPRVLIDAEHVVADLYGAVSTPHVFVADREGILRYRGAVDDVTFRQRKATRFFLEEAVEALLEGHLPTLTETPAYGCAIVREI